MKKKDKSIFPTEIEKQMGFLVVITGLSGAGKDTLATELLAHPNLMNMGLKKVVTHADRAPREGEIHGQDYYFVEQGTLETMFAKEELVEAPVSTGTSKKATSKKELLRIMEGEKLLWRVEVSRASEVINGMFFDRLFEEKVATTLKSRTIVVLVDAPKKHLNRRRKERSDYDPNEYRLRDEQDAPHIKVLRKKALVVKNNDGQLVNSIQQVITITTSHFIKTK